MNEKLVPVVEAMHHNLQKTAGGVKPESQLACRAVLVQVTDEDRVLGGMDSVIRINPVLARGVVNIHAT